MFDQLCLLVAHSALRNKSGPSSSCHRILLEPTITQVHSNTFALHRAIAYLCPTLVGVGVPGGREENSRKLLKNMELDSVMVKLDFSNAFNILYRNHLLSSVGHILPELAPFCHLVHAEISSLKYGQCTLLLEAGCQQGDPFGSLLFRLPPQPLLQISCRNSFWDIWMTLLWARRHPKCHGGRCEGG